MRGIILCGTDNNSVVQIFIPSERIRSWVNVALLEQWVNVKKIHPSLPIIIYTVLVFVCVWKGGGLVCVCVEGGGLVCVCVCVREKERKREL